MTQSNEQCWILVGAVQDKLWYGYQRRMTVGAPASVDFDPYYVLEKEEKAGLAVVGFFHTHPSFPAVPSDRDRKTMEAWCTGLGRDLLCVISGTDGLRGYWFEEDTEPVECQVMRFGHLLVGTTELEDVVLDEPQLEAIKKHERLADSMMDT